MSERPEAEPIETVKGGYSETNPASSEDVERAREQQELLATSPATTKDQSLTGESRPVDLDDVEGPAIADDGDASPS